MAAAGALLALAALDGGDLLSATTFQSTRGDTQQPTRNAVVFAAVYITSALSLLACVAHRSRLIYGPAIGFTTVAAAIECGVWGATGSGLGHHEAALLVSESAFLADALTFFATAWFLPAALAAVATLVVVWSLRRLGPRTRSFLPVLALAVSLMLAFLTVSRTFGKVYEFPVPVRIPVLVAWAANNTAPFYGEREEPRFAPVAPPRVDHVVLVMDESVSAQFIDATTAPWLHSAPAGVADYGVAAAISNLSSATNLILQAGLRPDEFPDSDLRSLKAPNIFSYFSAAGYHAALIDSQTYGNRPPNAMTGFDLEKIDTHLRLRELRPGTPEHAFDLGAIDDVIDQVKSHDRSFTYLLKTGAHFPYLEKSPPDQRPLQPTSTSSLAPRDPERVRNDYRNAIRWTADHFLAELLGALEATGREVLVVYTSDHGQSLDAALRGERFAPHATALRPPVEQAMVPLILLAAGDESRALLERNFLPERRHQTSAFEIFPTLLFLAGYEGSDVTAAHGPTLFDPAAARSERIFLSGNVYGGAEGMFVLNPRIGAQGGINRFEWQPPAERLQPSPSP